MTKVAGWVRDVVEVSYGRPILQVGQVSKHPDGRTVKIIGGQFWGTYGISNFWTWCEVMPDGTLGPKESGYGW